MADFKPRTSVWLRHAFLLPLNKNRPNSSGGSVRRAVATSAAYKFTNTSLGGNFAINNPPQFTHWADVPQPGLGRQESQWKHGMGRYYSEAIDDPGQRIHMTFGVPEFSNWTSFFTNFYDRHAAMLANTGKVSSLWYNLGNVGGYVVSLPLQPFILGITTVTRVYNFLAKNSPSKWYYFQPNMHSYWSAVNTMANELAINMGIIPRVIPKEHEGMYDAKEARFANSDWTDDRRQMANTFNHKAYPSIFRPDGGIDVMTLSRRTEIMSYRAQEAMRSIGDSASNLDDYSRKIKAYLNGPNGQVGKLPDSTPVYSDSREYFEEAIRNLSASPEGGDLDESNRFSQWEDLDGVKSFVSASQRDGSQFVTFRVNHNGSMSESFSNSVSDSQVAQALNSKVSEGRSANFNFMGGNLIPGAKEVVDAVKGFMAGALDAVNLSGLATLLGSAYIDIPKIWDGSTANLPRAEYTVPLYSPYGNVLSRYINMMVPMSMLMAGALPLSAGRSAYTSPFICQIYHQGRVVCQLGIIDSLTITRGTGNVGWNAENQMLGAEITFSVLDLSSIMHMPIKGGFAGPSWTENAARAAVQAGASLVGDGAELFARALTDGSVWDEHSTFSDYMAVLSSLSLADLYYVGNRLNLNLTRATRAFETWRSPSNFMSWVLDKQPARVLSAFAQFSERF